MRSIKRIVQYLNLSSGVFVFMQGNKANQLKRRSKTADS